MIYHYSVWSHVVVFDLSVPAAHMHVKLFHGYDCCPKCKKTWKIGWSWRSVFSYRQCSWVKVWYRLFEIRNWKLSSNQLLVYSRQHTVDQHSDFYNTIGKRLYAHDSRWAYEMAASYVEGNVYTWCFESGTTHRVCSCACCVVHTRSIHEPPSIERNQYTSESLPVSRKML
jgi:hypothetical protein